MQRNIKIVTFQRAHNFGAFLQAYALQEKLCNLGYNTEIVDYQNKNIDTMKPIHIYKKNNIKWTIKSLLYYIIYKDKLNKKYFVFNSCITNYLHLTKSIKNVKELSEIIQNKDILITGSDQVWNPKITKGVDDIYTLNLNNDIKKISYAPSIGSISCIDYYKEKLISNLGQIDKISVREHEAEKYLSGLLNRKVRVVLDPTLLLTRLEWNEVAKKYDNHGNYSDKYIIAYQVAYNEEYLKIVNNLAKCSNLKIIYFDLKNIYYGKSINKFEASPFEFINLIKNAEYVVTTSFHATVFSIIFNKKFWVVPHKITGSRVTDLLAKLDISNRVVNTLEEFNKKDYNEDINYNKINKILEKEREKSIEWLCNAIEK